MLVFAECDDGRFGHRINDIDWSSYVTNYKDQTGTPLCWAFSTTSYIEIMYNYLTGIKHVFSAMQVGENSAQQRFWLTDSPCYRPSKQLQRGHPTCAYRYVNARGLMFESDYKLYGYDVRRTIPIILSDRQPLYIWNNINTLLQQLKKTPVLAIYSTAYDHLPDVINNDYVTNHVVVLTNVCKRNTTIYLELLNSYGQQSQFHGYTYVRITADNGTIVDNRYILQHMMYFSVAVPVSTLTPEHNYIPIILGTVSNWLIIMVLLSLFGYVVRRRLRTKYGCFV